jgi:hypothetical protein
MTGVLSRRLFVRSAGLAAAAAAPLAVSSAAQAVQADDAKVRLQRLEDEKAVRALQQAYVKHVTAGAPAEAAALFADPATAKADATLRSLAAQASEAETIEIAADGASATLRLKCLARIEAPIEGRETVVEMARLQGDGVVRHDEARTLEIAAVKRDGVWRIARAETRKA